MVVVVGDGTVAETDEAPLAADVLTAEGSPSVSGFELMLWTCDVAGAELVSTLAQGATKMGSSQSTTLCTCYGVHTTNQPQGARSTCR